MQNSFSEHPNEEALERFLLNRSENEELESLETHILACESCIGRLETLELQIADLKTALTLSEEARIQRELNKNQQPFWKRWLTIPSLSWAGAACAALALGLTVLPHSILRNRDIAATTRAAVGDLSACSGSDIDSLASCRDSETTVLPENRPLDLRLATTDIPAGPVDVQVVTSNGSQIWQGQSTVSHEHAEVKLPGISRPGPYFLRFYAQGPAVDRELLREFRFEVK
jgi:hypothetical protein